MIGRIVKAVADFYYVYSPEEGSTYACKAKGIFRRDKMTPLVGDECEFEATHTQDIEGNVISILPRASELKRPPVANVDQALVVFAVRDPDPGLYLLDRFLVNMESLGLSVIICFNKTDIDRDHVAGKLSDLYGGIGYRVISTSTYEDEGMDSLKALLKRRITTVAGPSGVGKSSIINKLSGRNAMETGSVSDKSRRGKQTTRHTELIYLGDDTYIADTPGFSNADVMIKDKKELWRHFPEFIPYGDDCRFTGCSHISEPDCCIKQALEEGKISTSRYEHYTRIYRDIAQVRY